MATFALAGGGEIELAGRGDDRALLLGAFADSSNGVEPDKAVPA